MCNCKWVEIGSYDNQTTIKNPYTGRLVGIDNCILDEIKTLWLMGIETIESCCGHNKCDGYLIVADKHHIRMRILGYEDYINEFGVVCWYPKSTERIENKTL